MGPISLTEGRIPDAILIAERVRCLQAGSQPLPGGLGIMLAGTKAGA
jgi:hypothetical protein